jgi:hypothetical protein
MKTRTRQLLNGQWIVEARCWYKFGWCGVRIDKSLTTQGAAALGIYGLPMISLESAGSIHYPLCWHTSRHAAEKEERDVLSFHGA